MQIYLSLLICVIGALIYALSANPKMQELGRLSFVVGLLAFLLTGVGPALSVIHH